MLCFGSDRKSKGRYHRTCREQGRERSELDIHCSDESRDSGSLAGFEGPEAKVRSTRALTRWQTRWSEQCSCSDRQSVRGEQVEGRDRAEKFRRKWLEGWSFFCLFFFSRLEEECSKKVA